MNFSLRNFPNKVPLENFTLNIRDYPLHVKRVSPDFLVIVNISSNHSHTHLYATLEVPSLYCVGALFKDFHHFKIEVMSPSKYEIKENNDIIIKKGEFTPTFTSIQDLIESIEHHFSTIFGEPWTLQYSENLYTNSNEPWSASKQKIIETWSQKMIEHSTSTPFIHKTIECKTIETKAEIDSLISSHTVTFVLTDEYFKKIIKKFFSQDLSNLSYTTPNLLESFNTKVEIEKTKVTFIRELDRIIKMLNKQINDEISNEISNHESTLGKLNNYKKTIESFK